MEVRCLEEALPGVGVWEVFRLPGVGGSEVSMVVRRDGMVRRV